MGLVHASVWGLGSSLSSVMAEPSQQVLENVVPEGWFLPQAEGILPWAENWEPLFLPYLTQHGNWGGLWPGPVEAKQGPVHPCKKRKKKNTKPYPLPVTFGKICFVDSIPNLLEPSALPSFQPRTELIQTSLWPFSWLPCHPILIPSSTHGEDTSLLMPSWSPSLLTTLPHFFPPLILTPLLTLSLEGDIFISTLQRGLGAPQETPSQLPWFKFWTPV